jgi:hypothetical protein
MWNKYILQYILKKHTKLMGILREGIDYKQRLSIKFYNDSKIKHISNLSYNS